VLALAGAVPGVANAAGTWALQPLPASPPLGYGLSGVDCLSAAVGSAGNGQVDQVVSLAEHWNGTAWSQQDTPADSPDDALRGVACRPGGFCLAAGTGSNEDSFPIAETRGA